MSLVVVGLKSPKDCRRIGLMSICYAAAPSGGHMDTHVAVIAQTRAQGVVLFSKPSVSQAPVLAGLPVCLAPPVASPLRHRPLWQPRAPLRESE